MNVNDIIMNQARRAARLRVAASEAEQTARDTKRAREIGGPKGFLRVVVRDGVRTYTDSADPENLLPNG